MANESFFFLVLVLVICCTSTAPAHGVSKDVLGWAIIVVVTLAVHVNLIVMMAKAYQHACLLVVRRKNMQAHKAAKKQILPLNKPSSISESPATVDLKAKFAEGLNMEGIEELSECEEESKNSRKMADDVDLDQPQLLCPVVENDTLDKSQASAPEIKETLDKPEQ